MVYHIMKTGEVKTDITGHVVKIEHAEQAYRLINDLENRSIKKEVENHEGVRTKHAS